MVIASRKMGIKVLQRENKFLVGSLLIIVVYDDGSSIDDGDGCRFRLFNNSRRL